MEYVLITGASSGIGFALAKIFASRGHPLILVSSNEEKLSIAKNKIEVINDVPIITYAIDLSVLGNVSMLYKEIKQQNIFVSILINNAGYGLVGATEKIDIIEDEKMMILNTISLVELTKYFIADMYKHGNGKILNVASTGAFQPGPYTSTYFASKSFVLSYSRAIRYEAKKKGVSISVLCPGATKTNFFTHEGVKEPKNAMSAKKVALYTYDKMMHGKEIIIPGFFNKMQRFGPKTLIMSIVANRKKN